MRYLLLLIVFYSTNLSAQTDFNFNKRLIDCEDKWVVLPMSKDSTYTYGFIYLDSFAGLTFNLEGTFKIDKENISELKKQSMVSMVKQRLSPSNVKVAIVPNSKFEALKVSQYPDWLAIYKRDSTSVGRLFRQGFTYNMWNECDKALTYLEKVKAIDANYKGLDFEFAFAYNCLKQYDKAIVVLEKALQQDPKNCNLYKELLYAEVNLDLLDKATATCKKGLLDCADASIKMEMTYNLTYQFFKKKNKEQFKYWATESRKYALANDRYSKNIDAMEKELNK